MRAEIINSFIKAVKTTFNENGSIVLSTQAKGAVDTIELVQKVGVIINLFGESTIKGKVVIAFDKHIANKIIEVLLGAGSIDSIDASMAESMFGEYVNWIVASAVKEVENYSEKISDFNVDVKMALESEEKVLSENSSKFLTIDYLSQIGQAQLDFNIA